MVLDPSPPPLVTHYAFVFKKDGKRERQRERAHYAFAFCLSLCLRQLLFTKSLFSPLTSHPPHITLLAVTHYSFVFRRIFQEWLVCFTGVSVFELTRMCVCQRERVYACVSCVTQRHARIERMRACRVWRTTAMNNCSEGLAFSRVTLLLFSTNSFLLLAWWNSLP